MSRESGIVNRNAGWGITATVLFLVTVYEPLFTRLAHALSPKEIFKKTAPAVALILSYEGDEPGTGGTGCVIDPQGRILTNAHVVVDSDTGKPYSKIVAYFKPDKLTGDPEADLRNPVRAEVVRYDEKLDLAVLSLSRLSVKPHALTLSDSSAVESGDFVVAIGHPEQGGLWTVTTGIISSLVANLEGVKGKHAFQTDASINRGNSGGPLLDEDGRVIGINTLIVREAPDGGIITDVNFAVRSDVVKKWIDKEAMNVAYNWYSPPVGRGGVATRRIKAAPMGARILSTRSPFSFDSLLKNQATRLVPAE